MGQADLLRAIERARQQAIVAGDTAAARKVMSPRFQLIDPAGVPLTRGDLLGAVEAGELAFTRIEPTSPIAVHLRGSSATLRYRASFELQLGDTRLAHQAWTTVLYERGRGRWQVVWEQTTAVPNDPGLFLESIQRASLKDES